MHRALVSSAAVLLILGAPRVAAADDDQLAAPPPDPSSLPPDPTPLQPFPPAETELALKVTPIGYIEAYYAWNFNRPANDITNYRGFDNRHNSITLSTAALGATVEHGPVGARLMLQVGSMPSTYYASEPSLRGASGANATGPEVWKYLQEAYVTYKAPLGRGLTLKAGIEAAPIGLESFAVHENWTWSRSNLFFGLPFYDTALRATYPLSESLGVSVAVLNGWNAVVDNNEAKSVEAHVSYNVPNKIDAQVLYMGGIERSANAPEGQYWRHLFDASARVDVTSRLQLSAEGDVGFETNRFGTARWFAGLAAARAKATDWLFFAVRGDRFYEHQATDSLGHASAPLFWNGVEWVSSFTATAELKPHENISFRFEFRHDQADGLLYFTGDTIVGDGSANHPYLPNARRQQTLLLGATAWF